jgi:hypothetical protein
MLGSNAKGVWCLWGKKKEILTTRFYTIEEAMHRGPAFHFLPERGFIYLD